jgi:hypothetical protein
MRAGSQPCYHRRVVGFFFREGKCGMQQTIRHDTRFYRRRRFYYILLASLILLSVFTYLYMFVLPWSSQEFCSGPNPDGPRHCESRPMPWWQAQQPHF